MSSWNSDCVTHFLFLYLLMCQLLCSRFGVVSKFLIAWLNPGLESSSFYKGFPPFLFFFFLIKLFSFLFLFFFPFFYHGFSPSLFIFYLFFFLSRVVSLPCFSQGFSLCLSLFLSFFLFKFFFFLSSRVVSLSFQDNVASSRSNPHEIMFTKTNMTKSIKSSKKVSVMTNTIVHMEKKGK
jgi:hypothetical protein